MRDAGAENATNPLVFELFLLYARFSPACIGKPSGFVAETPFFVIFAVVGGRWTLS
jgi:hypothetical protein